MTKTTVIRLIVALVSTGILIGCSSGNVSPLDELPSANNLPDTEYLIGAGDVLDVQVWGESRLSGEVVVREDGRITLPLAGEVQAAGKQSNQLANDVTTKLSEFIPTVKVSVSVLAVSPIRYFLQGQFMKPGEYRSDKRITFLQAIATGGGFAPFADDGSLLLIRVGPDGDRRYQLDYNKVVDGRQPNPRLTNGDTIVVK